MDNKWSGVESGLFFFQFKVFDTFLEMGRGTLQSHLKAVCVYSLVLLALILFELSFDPL